MNEESNERSGKLFWWMVIIQVSIVCLIAAPLLALNYVGKSDSFRLKAIPVDPYDPFYGYYATLNYEIGQIEKTKIKGDSSGLELGDTLYVTLKKDTAQFAALKSVHLKPTELKEDEVQLKSRISYISPSDGVINVNYGFERYYGEQAEIEELEADIQNAFASATHSTDQVSVSVVIAKSPWATLFPWASYHVQSVEFIEENQNK